MKIKINGESKEFTNSSITVIELLSKENVGNPEMVSVQKNGEFISRDEFETNQILDGDEVDFLFFMGGGQFSYEF